MVARKVARWLAPLALAATVVAIYVVVHDTLSKPKRHTTPPAHLTLTTHTTAAKDHPAPAAPRSYTVKSGDTLSGIAAHFHTTLSTIENLNPNVNPGALQTGQRLRLPAG